MREFAFLCELLRVKTIKKHYVVFRKVKWLMCFILLKKNTFKEGLGVQMDFWGHFTVDSCSFKWTFDFLFFSSETCFFYNVGVKMKYDCKYYRISSCFAQLTTSMSRVCAQIFELTSFVPPVSDLRNQPYRRADAVRRSVRRRFDDQNLRPINGPEMVMWRGQSECDWMGKRSSTASEDNNGWDMEIRATFCKPSA